MKYENGFDFMSEANLRAYRGDVRRSSSLLRQNCLITDMLANFIDIMECAKSSDNDVRDTLFRLSPVNYLKNAVQEVFHGYR